MNRAHSHPPVISAVRLIGKTKGLLLPDWGFESLTAGQKGYGVKVTHEILILQF